MSVGGPRHLDAEAVPAGFRQRALDLVRSGRSVAEVAGLLGTAESCLHRWKRQDLSGWGLKPGTSQAESAELAAARQKIRELERRARSSARQPPRNIRHDHPTSGD